MLKVLSTKLKADQVDQFTAMAEQQGETKAGLLRRIVQDHLSSGEADRTASIGGPLLTTSSEKRPPLEKTNDVDGLPLSQNPKSKDSLLVYRTDAKGRPETSPKSSISKGWLLLPLILALCLKSQPSIVVDRSSALTTQSPQVDEHGLYTFRVGNTIVYSSSPIPFW